MNQRPKARHGYTLIELFMVIAAVGLISSLALSMLSALFRLQAASSNQLVIGQSVARLSDQLREDVWAAVDCELGESKLTIQLADGQQVTYGIATGEIRRGWLADGRPRRDTFDLQPGHVVTWEQITVDGSNFVKLRIERPDDVQRPPGSSLKDPRFGISPRGATILAEIGRDLRWQPETAELDP